jgi:hypothetical protein
MAQGGARFEKGSEETRARMAKVREARQKTESPTKASSAPFTGPRGQVVDVNEFTGRAAGGFPQLQFAGIDVTGQTPVWPGDK